MEENALFEEIIIYFSINAVFRDKYDENKRLK